LKQVKKFPGFDSEPAMRIRCPLAIFFWPGGQEGGEIGRHRSYLVLIVVTVLSAVPGRAARASRWVSGSDTTGETGVYGTKGVADGNNAPGGRAGSVSWTDSEGDFWLFGGEGLDANGDSGYLNDLWKYEHFSGFWTWVSGSNTVNHGGVYGEKGAAQPNNVAGARSGSVSWTDSNDNLWLFGGKGYDSAGELGYLNDLWRFDGTNWTWVSGSSSAGEGGHYGTRGQAEPANIPGARQGGVGWKDANDNFWLFGGDGLDTTMSTGYLNDLWSFDGNNWVWQAGSSTINQPGIYGTQGEPNPANIPGGRYFSISWTDANESFWLFGGSGYDDSSTGLLNDLWKYDGMMWMWVSGSASKDKTGVYGSKEVANPANVPGSRWRSVCWADGNGDLWLFGGAGLDADGDSGYLNDLWKFEVAGGVWLWMDGSNTTNQAGIYGTKGVDDPNGFPGARRSGVCWADAQGDFRLFGGEGYASSTLGWLNDLWKLRRFCERATVGDLNGDCIVNMFDVAVMTSHWLEDNWHY